MYRFCLLKPKSSWLVFMTIVAMALFCLALGQGRVIANNQRIVVIHHDGQEQVVASNAETVGEVLKRAKVEIGQYDAVEPAKDVKLVAANYNINVYRARPVTVVDGSLRYKIMTPHTSAKKIAQTAGLQTADEDGFELTRIDNFVAEKGAGLKLVITRSTPLKLVLYGHQVDAHTQAKTVKDLLSEKNISLGPSTGVSPGADTAISADMTVVVFKNGAKVINEEQNVAFETEQVRDADQEVGYRAIKEAGQNGKRLVTYELTLRDDKEVARKEIQNFITVRPKKQIEVVGIKIKGFSGDFVAALEKLRSCEGKYTSVNAAGGYYGAYQFNQSTWNGAAPASYVGVRPDQAPPEVQDQAARNLYVRRGWQPWPACSAKLGLQDIYR